MKMINESLSHNRDTEHFSCRNIYVDVIKGIAIFLMLWGHCIQYCYAPNGDFFSDMTFKVIYSFHMPLLMLISGYLFAITAGKYSKDVLLSKKASAIIHPIIGGNILCFLLTTALVQIVFKKNLHILIGGGMAEFVRRIVVLVVCVNINNHYVFDRKICKNMVSAYCCISDRSPNYSYVSTIY